MIKNNVKGATIGYDAVIFDLDGTLLNTERGILLAIKEAVAQLGYKAPEEERLRGFVGPPIKKSMSEEYGLNDGEADVATHVFRELYSKKYLMEAKPYDGIFELLKLLLQAGVSIGVATYKRTDYAASILEGFGIDIYCNAICGDDERSSKTKARIIEDCIEKIGIAPDRTLYVGDTMGDMIGAFDANTHFCAVTYGFGFEEGASTPEYLGKKAVFVANTAYDLIEYLFRG